MAVGGGGTCVVGAVCCWWILAAWSVAGVATDDWGGGGIVPPNGVPAVTTEASTTMTLVRLVDEPLARCLDGSPASYYFAPGASTSGKKSNGWVIYHEGGGWCTSLGDCCARAKTTLGSSLFNPNTTSTEDMAAAGIGWFSRKKDINPRMHDYNIVHIKYCDGASFSGTVTAAQTDVCDASGGHPLYFRGKFILEAVLRSLEKLGISDAEEVVLSGTSAGALATQLHANWYRQMLPETVRVTGLVDSGIFLDFDTDVSDYRQPFHPDELEQMHTLSQQIAGRYSSQLQWVFYMQQAEKGVNSDCVTDYLASGQTWRCMFSQYNAASVDVPLFFMQSIFDQWQLPMEAGADIDSGKYNKSYVDFYGGLLHDTIMTQVIATQGFGMRSSVPITKHGAYISSCHYHGGHWDTMSIQGFTPAIAHMNWITGGRSLYEQVEPFPCDECCGFL